MTTNLGLSFSKESLDTTLRSLTPNSAMRWIGLAGNVAELQKLLSGLARNFNTNIPQSALDAINEASARFWKVNRHPLVNYNVN